MKKYNTKLLAIGLSIVGIIILTVIGLTYAFFTASVGGNENANQTVVTTAELKLVFNDTQAISFNNALPGASVSKTFTVQNTGNIRQRYDIDIIDVNNTFTNNELIYTITSNNEDGGEVFNEEMPTEESTLLTSYIDSGVTITYTITLKFKEMGNNQNHNQGSFFNGKLQIVPRIMGVALGGYVYGDDDNILSGVTVELHSDPIKTTTNESGYYKIEDAPVGEHILYIKQGETTLGSKEVIFVSSSEPKINNQEISLPDKIKKYVNIKIDSGLNIYLEDKQTAMDKILADNIALSDENIDFKCDSSGQCAEVDFETMQTSYYTSDPTNGFYYTADNQYGEDNSRIYYFRGRIENNWVSFGGYLWRIVRTTSEGGIKLVYSGDGSVDTSGFISQSTAFNSNNNLKYYVGYTYNENSYTGVQTDSTIKKEVDTWYNTNLKVYKKYLSTTAIYCNDRSSEDENEFLPIPDLIAYPTLTNIYNVTPYYSYACPSENGSRYTVSTNTGNGYLSNPIALLTTTEIFYAGVFMSSNLNSYMMDNASNRNWWTMSPSFFSQDCAVNLIVVSSGSQSIEYIVDNTAGVRPSVSLKPDVSFTEGNGSKETPYIVE